MTIGDEEYEVCYMFLIVIGAMEFITDDEYYEAIDTILDRQT